MAFKRNCGESEAEIRRRIDEFARQLDEELGEVDEGEGDCWFDAIENRAVAVGDAVSAALVKLQSARQPPVEKESHCPTCGRTGRYLGDRPRELLTRRGPATIAEPRYFCPCCRKDFFPSDQGSRR